MDNSPHESRPLFGTIRDLAALATLSADWVRGRPLQVASGFADLLLKMLGLEFAYLRLDLHQVDGHELEVARAIDQPTTETQTREIGKALAPWLNRAGNEVRSVTNPLGSGTVRILVVPIGCEGEEGVLVAGSQHAGFPDEEDRLLLNIAAKQAATALQCRRAEEARRRLERERDELLARLRFQFERMPIACIVFDPELRIIDWNPAAEKIFGYRREEVLGKSADLLLVPPSSREFARQIQRRLVSGDIFAHATNENVTKDGRIILCDWHNTPQRHADGAVSAILAIAQDITERTQNEEKLGRSESLLAEAQQLAHIGSWSWDIASGKEIWSDEHYRIFGLRPQETAVTYERFLSLVHPDDRATLQDKVSQAFRDHQSSECCYRVPHPDGTVRVVRGRAQVVFDTDDKPVRMFGTAQDITERRRTEEALEESRRRLQAVFENSLEGIVLMDDAGGYVDGNPAICQLLGYSREELVRLSVWDVTPALDRERIPDLIGRFVSAGTLSGDYTLLCKDGTTREVEYRSVANMLPGLHLGVHRDITERKRAERALQNRHNLLHAVIEGIPEATYVKDLNGRYLLINSEGARLVGKAVEEVIGRDESALFDSEAAQRIREIDRRVMESESTAAHELVATAAGVTRTYLTTKAPFRSVEGEVIGVIGISRDITERKRAEEALRDSAARLQVVSRRVVEVQEEERRHLARELHDEIGQVLSAISVNLHAVKGVCDTAAVPRIDESINIVDQATQQVRNLSLDLRPSMLDDLGLVATLRWYADRQAQRAGFAVHFTVECSGSRLPADLTIACFRVAQEALTNVARHARARNVRVELRQGDDEVELAIRDDGVGFDPETARRGAARGESFGLLGIQERVELLGGRADIRSQPDHGTSIRVWFPMASPSSAQDPSDRSQR